MNPETATGFPPKDDAIIKKAVEQFRSSIVENYSVIRDFKDQSGGKVNIGFSCKIDTNGKLPVIKSSLRFARTVKDQCEDVVEDADQAELPMGEKGIRK